MRYLLASLLLVGVLAAQPKPPTNKDLPRILLAIPLSIPQNKERKIILRGLHLETSTSVECSEGGENKIEIVRKGKVSVPNTLKADTVGDTEVEIRLPATTARELQFVVVSSAGRSQPYLLPVDDASVVPEKEPNLGYRQAQEVKLGQTVIGTIGSGQDVDCFRFEGKVGQMVQIWVLAAKYGSPLDAVLTVSDEQGQILASADDTPDSRDALIELKLPRTGAYVATVQDAHDLGSPLHGYRLLLRRK